MISGWGVPGRRWFLSPSVHGVQGRLEPVECHRCPLQGLKLGRTRRTLRERHRAPGLWAGGGWMRRVLGMRAGWAVPSRSTVT